MDSSALSWPISRLAQDAVRAAIESLGNTDFTLLYDTFDKSLGVGALDTQAQVRAAACIYIEATRKDSPGCDTRVSGISLIWLDRNYPECAPMTARDLVNQMLPAYYDYRGQSDRSKPHRGYLVYEYTPDGFQVTITCVLYHLDEQTQTIVHGRDDSLPCFVQQVERVDRYVFDARPGDRIRFTITQSGESNRQEAWYTVTTRGPE